jgi:prepilin-type N-terminal cleavage/methylation domain-containing protein
MKQGFSLVESLVALAIVSLLVWPIAGWLWTGGTRGQPWHRIQAQGMLEARIAEHLLAHRKPPQSQQTVDMLGNRWEIRYEVESIGTEHCIHAMALRNARDTVASSVGCFHE